MRPQQEKELFAAVVAKTIPVNKLVTGQDLIAIFSKYLEEKHKAIERADAANWRRMNETIEDIFHDEARYGSD
jgi:hypothetical protein